MKRAESGSTTFTEILTKTSMYQASLFVLNLILMVSAVVMIFAGYSLITTYHFDKVYYPNSKLVKFWSLHALPWTLMGLGISALGVAVLGFIFFSLQIRPLIMVYVMLLIPLVLGKFGLIHMAFTTENVIRKIAYTEMQNEAMQLYHEKEDFRVTYDQLQTHMRCCGGTSYLDYVLNTYPNQTYICYPKSCCIGKGSGECIAKDRNDHVGFNNSFTKTIFIDSYFTRKYR